MKPKIPNQQKAYNALNGRLINYVAQVQSIYDRIANQVATAIDDEDAADYMLTGSVKLTVQNNGKKQERTYIVNIELTDLHTHRTVDMFEPSEDVKDYLKKIGSVKSR